MSIASKPSSLSKPLRSSLSSVPAWSLAMAIFSTISALELLKYQNGVRSAEAERIGKSGVYRKIPRDVRNVIEVALGIRGLVIHGGTNGLVFNGHDGKSGLHPSGRAKEMSCHALCGAHRQTLGVLAKNRLYGLGLVHVVIICI